MTTIHDAARRLAALGLCPIYTTATTRKPFTEGWAELPYVPPENIPTPPQSNANLGLRTGHIEGARFSFLVVDVDDAEAQVFVEKNLPPSPMVTLTARGFHLYFRLPAGTLFRNGTGVAGMKHLDVRGHHGYATVAPSVHKTGVIYQEREPWTPELLLRVPALSPELLARLVKLKDPTSSDKGTRSPDLAEPLEEGGRNAGLTSLAGRLRHELSALELEAKLHEHNQVRCKPPLLDHEVTSIARSVARHGTEERPRLFASANLADLADQATTILGDREPNLFMLDTAKPCIVQVAGWDGKSGWAKETSLEEVRGPRLLDALAGHINWVQGKKRRRVRPPKDLPSIILSRPNLPFRPIRAVVDTPVLRPDGTVHDVPGTYDALTRRLFLAPQGQDFGSFVTPPDMGAATTALNQIEDLFVDFPFAEQVDRSSAIAALLTVLGRAAIQGPVPLFLFEASTAGSGKTLIANCISRIATGQPAPTVPQTGNSEEQRKMLTSLLLSGTPLASLDNVNALGDPQLDMLLTTGKWHDRRLGSNTMVTVTPQTVLFATGNNVELRADTVRRVIGCRLEPDVEYPEQRQGFRHPKLEEFILEHRTDLVRAGLTILQAHAAAGYPGADGVHLGGFEGWARVVPSALVWLGLPNPILTQTSLAEGHTQNELHRRLFQTLSNAFGTSAFTARAAQLGQLESAASSSNSPARAELRAVLEELMPGNPGPEPVAVGKILTALHGRVLGGLRLVKVKRTNTGIAYSLVPNPAKPT